MARKTKKPSPPRTFEGPAKQGEGQVLALERFNEGTAGTAKRVRNVASHPLRLAYHRGQISEAHFQAGETYRIMFEKMRRSGLDSSQALDRSGGGGNGAPFTQTQVDAINGIKKIEAAMGPRDRRIIRYFCGEGMSPVESVQRVTSVHPSSVRYRIVEALEGLEDALEQTRIRKVA
jgi:hypothetical protein